MSNHISSTTKKVPLFFPHAESGAAIARTLLGIAITGALFAGSNAAYACATCGCSLSSDGALGYSTSSGWGISLDETYINQDQLRSGRGSITPQQVQAVNGQEVEKDTINRYLTLGVSYSIDADWNVKLLAPYVDRSHTTYGTDATLPLTSSQISSAHVSSIGDIKLIGSYQGLLPLHNLGLQLGVKLPTGDYGGPNGSNTGNVVGQGTVGRNPVGFGPTGNSASSYLDTSLQAGNGSTDLILGAYYYQAISQDFDAFVNAQFEFAVHHNLNDVGADYRPGNQSTISFGVRYEANPQIVPQLQVNITSKSNDQGALADTHDTAGTVAYLSPGITYAMTPALRMYGFLQLPVYSQLSGNQLFPHYTATAGISYHF